MKCVLQSSIHSDSGDVLPLIFRPPAFLPFASPLVVGSFLPHATVKSALFWQFMMQSYCAGFNYANRNSSSEQGKKMSLNQVVMVAGSVSCSTCAGAVPQIIIRQLGISSAPLLTLLRSLLPVPLAAALASFSVYTVRYEELEKGIQVFDSNGNSVGISKAAGEKAIRETAVSRVALLGTSAALPNLLMLFLMRTRFKRNPLLVTPIRHLSAVLTLGLMIPVSFSLFPQLGMIEKESLEKELQDATTDGQLFYHRGL
ncbi:sideroflexin-4 isoform X3 [Lampris incognitus]|uniref:sideroflexin-4 isoform X3 n=1 Tax=Lampris incognitus TaxID=2546036 RepID=UPI0024B4D6D2|nr:sideroflexin-4 isoform X3 [Lampris incognitus]